MSHSMEHTLGPTAYNIRFYFLGRCGERQLGPLIVICDVFNVNQTESNIKLNSSQSDVVLVCAWDANGKNTVSGRWGLKLYVLVWVSSWIEISTIWLFVIQFVFSCAKKTYLSSFHSSELELYCSNSWTAHRMKTKCCCWAWAFWLFNTANLPFMSL